MAANMSRGRADHFRTVSFLVCGWIGWGAFVSNKHGDDTSTDPERDRDQAESRWAAGDDERENREHIAATGEPEARRAR
jgi:hypothetical protein